MVLRQKWEDSCSECFIKYEEQQKWKQTKPSGGEIGFGLVWCFVLWVFFPFYSERNDVNAMLWGKGTRRWWEEQEWECKCSKTGIGKNHSGKRRLKRKLREQKIQDWEKLMRLSSFPEREKVLLLLLTAIKIEERKNKILFKKLNLLKISFKAFNRRKQTLLW